MGIQGVFSLVSGKANKVSPFASHISQEVSGDRRKRPTNGNRTRDCPVGGIRMNMMRIAGEIGLLAGAFAAVASAMAQPVDTRPMVEWVIPALTTNKPQT